MYFDDINIKNELLKPSNNPNRLLAQVGDILSTSVKKEEDILSRLQQLPVAEIMDIKQLSEQDKKAIFTLEKIEKVCIKYNLRFLDTSFFKSDFPYEAIVKIKEFEVKYNVTIKHFKIIAPANVFKLEDCNEDPLLFAQLADNRYYLIHQWGHDLSWYRGIISYPIRNIYAYFFTMWIPAAAIAFSLPFKWLNVATESELSLRLWLTVHCFLALFFFVIFMASTSHKNFSATTWNSKYYNT
jgi:hypothetical protein